MITRSMTSKKLLAENLRILMAKENVSGKELAANLEVSVVVIAKWRNGHSSPTANHLKAIASFFGIDEETLTTKRLFDDENNQKELPDHDQAS